MPKAGLALAMAVHELGLATPPSTVRSPPPPAILDVTIRGGHVYPVAEQLLVRGIPFLLASGYGGWALPEHLQDRPRLTKPFTDRDLEEQVRLLCRKER